MASSRPSSPSQASQSPSHVASTTRPHRGGTDASSLSDSTPFVNVTAVDSSGDTAINRADEYHPSTSSQAHQMTSTTPEYYLLRDVAITSSASPSTTATITNMGPIYNPDDGNPSDIIDRPNECERDSPAERKQRGEGVMQQVRIDCLILYIFL